MSENRGDKLAETPLLNEEELKLIKEEFLNSGQEKIPIMEIKEFALKKVNLYKKILFFVNLPLMVGLPICLEGGFILDPIHKQTASTLYLMLSMTDFMLFFNSVVIYNTIKRITTSIEYLPKTDKVLIK